MGDLTVIFITASEIRERFAEYQRRVLREAAKGYPIISVSRKPLDFGTNILDDGERNVSNIYRQMLRAAKIATTEYVATAEDDCLYHGSHFSFARPKPDEFLYNQNRFALFTWGDPMYSWRNRKSNCSLIAPRKLLIEALEERFAKWPHGTPANLTGELGRNMVDRNLGITLRKSVEAFAEVSVVQFNHDASSEDRQRSHRKKPGQIKVYDIFHWGKASELVKHYA